MEIFKDSLFEVNTAEPSIIDSKSAINNKKITFSDVDVGDGSGGVNVICSQLEVADGVTPGQNL